MRPYASGKSSRSIEASLAMLNLHRSLPDEHWEGKIANGTFRWVAYHTLFFLDLYLLAPAHAFELRDLHRAAATNASPSPASDLQGRNTRLRGNLPAENRQRVSQPNRPNRCRAPQASPGTNHPRRTARLQHPPRATSHGPVERVLTANRRGLPGRSRTTVGEDRLAMTHRQIARCTTT